MSVRFGMHYGRDLCTALRHGRRDAVPRRYDMPGKGSELLHTGVRRDRSHGLPITVFQEQKAAFIWALLQDPGACSRRKC